MHAPCVAVLQSGATSLLTVQVQPLLWQEVPGAVETCDVHILSAYILYVYDSGCLHTTARGLAHAQGGVSRNGRHSPSTSQWYNAICASVAGQDQAGKGLSLCGVVQGTFTAYIALCSILYTCSLFLHKVEGAQIFMFLLTEWLLLALSSVYLKCHTIFIFIFGIPLHSLILPNEVYEHVWQWQYCIKLCFNFCVFCGSAAICESSSCKNLDQSGIKPAFVRRLHHKNAKVVAIC